MPDMSLPAEADSSSSHIQTQKDVVNQSETVDSIHDDVMPVQSTNEPETHTSTDKDDAATMAASEELKHTTISDKEASKSKPNSTQLEPPLEDKQMEEKPQESTPDPEPIDAQDQEMKDKLLSPKKKRGRDTYDESKELDGEGHNETASSVEGNIVNGGRLEREGPEKKRHRDTSVDPLKVTENSAEVKDFTSANATDTLKSTSNDPTTSGPAHAPSPKPTFGSSINQKPETSSSAFANSGFSALSASSISPFGAVGASKPSVFGGNISTTSGFGALAGSKSSASSTIATTTGGFGGLSGDKSPTGFTFGSSPTSGFGGIRSGSDTIFRSPLGNGFAGGSGPKLSSFAAPGKDTAPISKPAKAFGAPESDEEDGSGDDGSEEGVASDEEKEIVEEKKRVKVFKVPVPVEDGESGEATMLQLRAKLFALESKEAGWKERGVGTLKINVPRSCASFDGDGLAIPGSFDISGLEDEEEDESNGPRVPRLIMRQENTHRVVLNTILVRAMEFQDKPSNSAAQIIFTAFEGEKEPKPVNMLLKMSEANARLFRSEIQSIQHEL